MFPKEHLEKIIREMKIGEVAYTLPWALGVHKDRVGMLDPDYPAEPAPHGTVEMKIQKLPRGFKVWLPKGWKYPRCGGASCGIEVVEYGEEEEAASRYVQSLKERIRELEEVGREREQQRWWRQENEEACRKAAARFREAQRFWRAKLEEVGREREGWWRWWRGDKEALRQEARRDLDMALAYGDPDDILRALRAREKVG